MSAYKIAVIGDNDSVIGFKALGLETISAANTEEARQVFRQITRERDSYAIVYITEQLAEHMTEEINSIKDSLTPAVILIPSKNGTLGLGMSALNSAVERAIGANIL